MRFIILTMAAAGAVAVATPALAQDARFEARGGVIWSGGETEGTAGVAAGADFDITPTIFAGPEVTVDRVIEDGTRVSVGFGGRVGTRIGSGTRVYGAAAYQTKPCGECEDSISAGLGAEQDLGSGLYGKLEYRHYFVGNGFKDANGVMAGLGIRF